MPDQMGMGIVGTGMIANVVANAIEKSSNAKLLAVSGRRLETATAFAHKRQGVTPVEGFKNLIARSDIDAIYVATPTIAKEEITLTAIHAGKHVLVDKPFMDTASLRRMTDAAKDRAVAFMDATHFVHHPRTLQIQQATQEKLGTPASLYTAFYFPFSDRSNIRLNMDQEPTGALGDMAWYSMRAIVEFLRPAGKVSKVLAVAERDEQTRAVTHATGLIAFSSGEVSTFDVGYTAGTALMDLQLIGRTGVIAMDDFVLDWANSWAFQNTDSKTGYTFKTGPTTRAEVAFVDTPSAKPQEVLMVENFVNLCVSKDMLERARWIDSSLKTQEYLDAVWSSCTQQDKEPALQMK